MLLRVVTLWLSGDTNQAFQCQDSLHSGTEEVKTKNAIEESKVGKETQIKEVQRLLIKK